jgi:glycine/D-amino acid oxidase-like deaminating enzyme
MPRPAEIDPNLSLWFADGAGYSREPALSGRAFADVAIIGGGFTGVSTAYHLSQALPNLSIILLEAKSLANGASGRNGGLMLNWINGTPDTDEMLVKTYQATRRGIDLILGIIRENGLAVRYTRKGCLEVQTTPQRAEEAHARAERLRTLGIPVSFVSGEALAKRSGAQRISGGLYDPSEGQLHGVDFIRALKPLLLARGVRIFEDSPVRSIEEGRSITLHTQKGSVRAGSIVLATNGYTPRLGYFRRGIFPLHSHVLATEPVNESQRAALGWGDSSGFCDDLDRIAYAGLSPMGNLIFGGGSNAAYSYLYGGKTQYSFSPVSAARSFQTIRARLLDYFPGAAPLRIQRRWTGTLGITMSRMCSMGVRGAHRNVYYALGYSGHGVTLANLAGKVLSDLYQGNHDAWRDQPFYQKHLGGIPPEPFRWIGYQAYTRLTGRSPRSK